MSMSIFEKECERMQPILLERKSKMTEREAVEMVKEIINIYSFPYVSGCALAKILAFSEDAKENSFSSLTFKEVISKLKEIKESECPLVFAGYEEGIAKIYGRTFEEIEALLADKKYWMSYGAS